MPGPNDSPALRQAEFRTAVELAAKLGAQLVAPDADALGRANHNTGPWRLPAGVLLHHTGWARAADDVHATRRLNHMLGEVGRPPDAPAPCANFGVTWWGTVVPIAAGATNHAGTGRQLSGPLGIVYANRGNVSLWGIEIDSPGDGTYGPGQLDAAVLLSAALLLAADEKRDPAGWSWVPVWSHHEYAGARKPDPAGVDMDSIRERVRQTMVSFNAPPQPLPAPSGARAHHLAILAASRSVGDLWAAVGAAFAQVNNYDVAGMAYWVVQGLTVGSGAQGGATWGSMLDQLGYPA